MTDTVQAVQFNSPRITLDEPKPLSYLGNIAHKKATKVALTCFQSLVHWFLTTFSCFYPAYDKLYKAEVAKLSVVNDKKSNATESEDDTPSTLSPNRESATIEDASLRLPTTTANPNPAPLPNQATAVAETASLRIPIFTDKPAEGIADDDAAAPKFRTLLTSAEPTRTEDFDPIQTVPPAPAATPPPAKGGNTASKWVIREAADEGEWFREMPPLPHNEGYCIPLKPDGSLDLRIRVKRSDSPSSRWQVT